MNPSMAIRFPAAMLAAAASLALGLGAARAGGPASATAREPAKAIVPAVQAKARAINLRQTDLTGAGWKTEPTETASSNSSSFRCSYYHPDLSDLTENGDALSVFQLPSGSLVMSSTSIFESAAQARGDYARESRPALARCLGDIWGREIGLVLRRQGHPNKVRIGSA